MFAHHLPPISGSEALFYLPSRGNDRELDDPHRRPCPLEARSGVRGLRLWGPKDVVAEGEGRREGLKTSHTWTVLFTELDSLLLTS